MTWRRDKLKKWLRSFGIHAVLLTGAPAMLTSIDQLELFARSSRLAASVLPTRQLSKLPVPGLSRVKHGVVAKEMEKSHVIVGTVHDIASGVGKTVFFAFFPSGLVLYWVTNNLLSIAQQWYITRNIEKAAAAH